MASLPSLPPPSRRKANSFAALSKEDRCFLITTAAIIAIEEGLDYIEAAQKVAIKHNLVHIQSIEKKAVKQAVYRAVKTRKQFDELDVGDEDETVGEVTQEADNEDNGVLVNNRIGKCGKKRKPLTMLLPADKKKASRVYKGAESHTEYRKAVREAVLTVSSTAASTYRMAHETASSLQQQGISMSSRHCYKLVKAYRETGRIPSPQKPGGVFVPSSIEDRIVRLIKGLRQRKLPVFGDDVMGWCTEFIKGTPYAAYFPDGKASVGWYRGFLRRTGMTTGTVRPLEITRSEWLTEENLATYYDVAEGVLLNAGVAVRNTAYVPGEPFSQSILITRPERIVSFDETRLELDCTRTSKARTDRVVRSGYEDRGESLATKSSATASAICGRTGTGLALPPYIVFSSGQTFQHSWAPAYVSEVLDSNGQRIQWRYNHNAKGSVTEEWAADYLKQIIAPALHGTKPAAEAPGEQGVIFCDGVGTHLGITVLETAIEMGAEVILRVPHLSFVLQGEDTINFGPLKVSYNCISATNEKQLRNCDSCMHAG